MALNLINSDGVKPAFCQYLFRWNLSRHYSFCMVWNGLSQQNAGSTLLRFYYTRIAVFKLFVHG